MSGHSGSVPREDSPGFLRAALTGLRRFLPRSARPPPQPAPASSRSAASRRSARPSETGHAPHSAAASGRRRTGMPRSTRPKAAAMPMRPWTIAALRQRDGAQHRAGVKQQHRRGGSQPRRIRAVGGGGRQHDAVGAHDGGQHDQDAARAVHQARSCNRRTIAARNSGMPAPERDDVSRTSGNAAGCLASAAVVCSMFFSSSAAFTWSALVSTT